jgi:hypothetical protein
MPDTTHEEQCSSSVRVVLRVCVRARACVVMMAAPQPLASVRCAAAAR